MSGTQVLAGYLCSSGTVPSRNLVYHPKLYDLKVEKNPTLKQPDFKSELENCNAESEINRAEEGRCARAPEMGQQAFHLDQEQLSLPGSVLTPGLQNAVAKMKVYVKFC